MLRLFKTVSRNKFFYIFALLIIIMFPHTLYLQSNKDLTIIITTVGIDKEEDTIKLSALAVIPKGGNDISSNLEVFEGEGATVSEALNKISNDTGKKIGLSHCDCIALSKDAMEDNITKYLDYFIRTSNLATNATLIATEGKASDLLSATKNSNNLLDLSLRNIVQFKEERSLLESVNIEKFYRQYYTEGSTFYMPILTTEDNTTSSEEGSNTSGGSSNSGENSSEGSGGGAGQGEKKISDNNKVAVLIEGKYYRELDEDEYFIYSLINNNTKGFSIKVEDINDSAVTHSDEIFEQVNKIVFPSYSFKDGTPTATYNIILNLRVDEISGENFSYEAIDGLHNFLDDSVKGNIQTQVKNKLSTSLEKMRKEKMDILNLYANFNAFKTKEWKKYINSLEDKDDYLSKIDIKINLTLLNVF